MKTKALPSGILILAMVLILIHACKRPAEYENIDILPGSTEAGKPQVIHAGMAAPGFLGITFQEKYPTRADFLPYEEQEGDSVVYNKDGRGLIHGRILYREGKATGFLAGEDESMLSIFESIEGDSIHEKALALPESYTLYSEKDENYREGKHPAKVFRKSRVLTWAEPGKDVSMMHTVYLDLPQTLKEGIEYHLRFKGLNTGKEEITYIHYPKNTRSEAIHVSQVGFRPDDPLKIAFLSLWKGTGGAHRYDSTVIFHLVDRENDSLVYSGTGVMALAADSTEHIKETKNYSKTGVWHLEFSDFNEPGTYRVYVANLGCSYPFPILAEAWEDALKLTMQGFLTHRSGIALGPPLIDYDRPRPFHPDEGLQVYQSEYSILDNWMENGGQNGVFEGLLDNRTGKTLDDAWGSYMDAGDWDRRIMHLWATRQLLEVFELFPEYSDSLKLILPESENHLPDLMDEILFNIDGYRRMQTAEGGIRYGIESAAHPVNGEPSWMESLPVMAFEPDPWSSYIYAGVTAQAARLLRPYDPGLSDVYKESALKAIKYAETETPRLLMHPESRALSAWQTGRILNERCFAAIQIFALTGIPIWHDIAVERLKSVLLETGTDNIRDLPETFLDAAFAYTLLAKDTNPAVQEATRETIKVRGQLNLDHLSGNAYFLTSRNIERPMLNGYYTAVSNQELCRTHFLTGDQKYLSGAIKAAQYTAGANPMNLVMTTGLGIHHVQRPLHIDSRVTGQKAPPGITVYGQSDYEYYIKDLNLKDTATIGSHYNLWGLFWIMSRHNVPSVWTWPPHEGYYDIPGFPNYSEYTIMQTFGPVNYAFGYLAARGKK